MDEMAKQRKIHGTSRGLGSPQSLESDLLLTPLLASLFSYVQIMDGDQQRLKVFAPRWVVLMNS